jgi:plasmid stability protein
MATLHIENVPEELIEAIEERAKRNHTTIGDEVLHRLHLSFPSKSDLAKRQERMKRFLALQKSKPASEGPFPSAEQMIREDRDR